jgi:hypothetical protein
VAAFVKRNLHFLLPMAKPQPKAQSGLLFGFSSSPADLQNGPKALWRSAEGVLQERNPVS